MVGAYNTELLCFQRPTILAKNILSIERIFFLLKLLTETDGKGQLNISIQQNSDLLNLVLEIFINESTTT